MDMHSSIELDISFEIVQDINHILTFLYCLEEKSTFWEVSSTNDLSEIDFALEILPGIKRLLTHKLEINPELHKGLHYIQSLLPDNVEKIGFSVTAYVYINLS